MPSARFFSSYRRCVVISIYTAQSELHAFWNAGDEPARLLEMISPAGFEDYFREMAPLLAVGERDAAAVGIVAERYGVAIDFGTVPGLIEAHGLQPR